MRKLRAGPSLVSAQNGHRSSETATDALEVGGASEASAGAGADDGFSLAHVAGLLKDACEFWRPGQTELAVEGLLLLCAWPYRDAPLRTALRGSPEAPRLYQGGPSSEDDDESPRPRTASDHETKQARHTCDSKGAQQFDTRRP